MASPPVVRPGASAPVPHGAPVVEAGPLGVLLGGGGVVVSGAVGVYVGLAAGGSGLSGVLELPEARGWPGGGLNLQDEREGCTPLRVPVPLTNGPQLNRLDSVRERGSTIGRLGLACGLGMHRPTPIEWPWRWGGSCCLGGGRARGRGGGIHTRGGQVKTGHKCCQCGKNDLGSPAPPPLPHPTAHRRPAATRHSAP